MATQVQELYNLRWNSYSSNMINVFSEHQHKEALVDVTLSCQGKFLKAHRLVLSASSIYFQKVFEHNTHPQLLILLNNIKFKDLELAIRFMYKGEVKVSDADLQDFLSLGKLLQIKGLCSVELKEKKLTPIKRTGTVIPDEPQVSTPTNIEEPQPQVPKALSSEKPQVPKALSSEKPQVPKTSKARRTLISEPQVAKKSRTTSPPISISDSDNDSSKKSEPINNQAAPQLPRPPNAFMLFADQWRKKFTVEFPNESNKEISIRLAKMWKGLAQETKDSFYEDAKQVENEQKTKTTNRDLLLSKTSRANSISGNGKRPDRSDSRDVSKAPEVIHIKMEEHHSDNS